MSGAHAMAKRLHEAFDDWRAREAQLRRDTRLAERQRIEADRATPPDQPSPEADARR